MRERRGNSISALVFPPLLSQPERERERARERERREGCAGGERETMATREREGERRCGVRKGGFLVVR